MINCYQYQYHNGDESRGKESMYERAIENMFRNALIVLIVGFAAFFAVVAGLKLGNRMIEKFKAESSAQAVVRQNPEVFERLAEM